MSLTKNRPSGEQKWKEWDRKAQKNGVHSGVRCPGGGVYSGEWKNDLKEGTGTMEWPDGMVYEGEWQQDRRNGKGALYSKNSKGEKQMIYEGEWSNDKKHGKGSYYLPNGVYQGSIANNKRKGNGRMVFTNGDEYEGDWLNDQRDGQGFLLYTNGNWFNGEWRTDQKNGLGKYYYASNKHIYEGVWQNDTAKTGALREPTETDWEELKGQLADSDILKNIIDSEEKENEHSPKLILPQIGLVDPNKVLEEEAAAVLSAIATKK